MFWIFSKLTKADTETKLGYNKDRCKLVCLQGPQLAAGLCMTTANWPRERVYSAWRISTLSFLQVI